jgi:hypothetical protein
LSNGAERDGWLGGERISCSMPSISDDGSTMTHVVNFSEYNSATTNKWILREQTLSFGRITGDGVRGTGLLSIPIENVFGSRIFSQSISGNGEVIAFYAGGEIQHMRVRNIEMPPYEPISEYYEYDEQGKLCYNVYCYVITQRGDSRYLSVVPDPDSPTEPLVVARSYLIGVNSYNTENFLAQPPSISSASPLGRCRIALVAGLVWGESKTGIYIYEPESNSSYRAISFGQTPGTQGCEESLVTGSHPSISRDALSLAYYLREVEFPQGYNDIPSYEEGGFYCPYVQKDDVVFQRIPSGDRIKLIESTNDPAPPTHTSRMGLDMSGDGSNIVFISRADKTGGNRDHSHEVFLASRI